MLRILSATRGVSRASPSASPESAPLSTVDLLPRIQRKSPASHRLTGHLPRQFPASDNRVPAASQARRAISPLHPSRQKSLKCRDNLRLLRVGISAVAAESLRRTQPLGRGSARKVQLARRLQLACHA